jgi:hypothetical protein
VTLRGSIKSMHVMSLREERAGTLLGTFTKLENAAVGFVMSVCVAVHMVQFNSCWTILYETGYLRIFKKSVKKIKVSLKSDKNNMYFT